MGTAISALVAALAVVYSLSVTATTSEPVTTILRVILDLTSGRGRVLTANEAMSAIFYAVVVYLLVFSVSFFLLRFVGIFLLALGVPDDAALRENRQLRRNDRYQFALQRRQARLNGQYLARAMAASQRGRSFDTNRGAANLAKSDDTITGDLSQL